MSFNLVQITMLADNGHFRPPLQGIGNVVPRPSKKHRGSSEAQFSSASTNTNVVPIRSHGMSTNGNQAFSINADVHRAKKKQRKSKDGVASSATTKGPMTQNPNSSSWIPKSFSSRAHDGMAPMSTSSSLPSEIPTRQWLVLPQSRYGIHYELGCTTTSTNSNGMTNGLSMLQMAAHKSPFEMKMQQLRYLLQSKYPTGASLLYVREIFEPGDIDYGLTSTLPRPPSIDVTKLTKEQVDRIRLIIVDDQRREMMMSFLNFYQSQPFHSRAAQVVDHFSDFKTKYSKIRDFKMKFNRLFCFTFTLNRFDEWLYRMDRGWGRQKLVEGVALRWKNLLKCHTPEELGIDQEFSYLAVLSLLQIFKQKIESAPTFGDPQMVFKFE